MTAAQRQQRINGLPWNPDEPITAEQAQQRCAEIGLPPTIPWRRMWRRIWTPEPIKENSVTWCVQQTVSPTLSDEITRWRNDFGDSPADRLYRKYPGWRVEFFGMEMPVPDANLPASRVLFATPRFLLRDEHKTTVMHCVIYHIVAWRHGSAMSVEMRFGRWNEYCPNDWTLNERWSVSGFSKPAKATEWNEAQRGLRLLQQITTSGGQHKLEDKPDHPWPLIADRAIELRRVDPFATLDDLVDRLGMLDEEGKDRRKTLSRWIAKRTKEINGS